MDIDYLTRITYCSFDFVWTDIGMWFRLCFCEVCQQISLGPCIGDGLDQIAGESETLEAQREIIVSGVGLLNLVEGEAECLQPDALSSGRPAGKVSWSIFQMCIKVLTCPPGNTQNWRCTDPNVLKRVCFCTR